MRSRPDIHSRHTLFCLRFGCSCIHSPDFFWGIQCPVNVAMRYFTIITGLQIGHVIYIFRLNFTDKHKNVALSENKQNWRTSLDSFPISDADHNTY